MQSLPEGLRHIVSSTCEIKVLFGQRAQESPTTMLGPVSSLHEVPKRNHAPRPTVARGSHLSGGACCSGQSSGSLRCEAASFPSLSGYPNPQDFTLSSGEERLGNKKVSQDTRSHGSRPFLSLQEKSHCRFCSKLAKWRRPQPFDLAHHGRAPKDL